MYVGVVYFAGPKSRWAERIDESETIATFDSMWQWHVRFLTRGLHAQLDATRCGYAILKDQVCIEQYDPPIEELAG